MSAFRPILFIIGIFVVTMGLAMIVPAITDAIAGHRDWITFAISAGCAAFVGGLMVTGSMGSPITLTLRQGFALTTLSWIVFSAVGALPLAFSGLGLSYADAFFEAVSGLTTTGSTVLVGLDTLPPGILLWRAMLQWVGGIGIIVMAIAMLPYLRIGGMQLFRMESSDKSEKVLPRIAQMATATSVAYALLTLGCAAAYAFAGMTGFEAVTHAMSTVSTGGYSTYDASLGHFANPAIEWVAMVFMLLGALPFVIYIQIAHGRGAAVWNNSEVRAFLGIVVAVSLTVTVWLWLVRDERLVDAFRLVTFNVVSVVTTTGFATTDYGQWGGLAVVVFFILTFIGGCTGSTAGGIKMLRLELAALMVRNQFQRLYQPHGILIIRYRGQAVADDVVKSAMNFIFIFILSFAVLSICLSAVGLDFITAVSGAATALANVGPGLGPVIGPAGNFSTLPDAAKWLLSAGMLLGRLEFLTLLVMLSPRFWRDW
ncbi:MAG TPA: TrkH family potassium uptake protein [Kiloniellaceae bacterium]